MKHAKKKICPVKPRQLRVESLEDRRLLAVGDPVWCVTAPLTNITAHEAELWELTNRMRTAPRDELYHLFSNVNTLTAYDERINNALKQWGLDPQTDPDKTRAIINNVLNAWRSLESVDPLAFNTSLQKAAEYHNAQMIANGRLGHQVGTQEPPLDQRLEMFGFNRAPGTSVGENINANGQNLINGTPYSVASYLFASFVLDWGHNIDPADELFMAHLYTLMNPAFTEMGVSITSTTNALRNWVITTDYGTSVAGAKTDGAFLLGAIYNDKNSDGYYSVAEGISSATVTITKMGADGQVVLNYTYANGINSTGQYQIYLTHGTYMVTVSGGGFSQSITRTVVIDGHNIKLDFRPQDIGRVGPILDLNGTDTPGYDTDSALFVEGGGFVGIIPSEITITVTGETLSRAILSFVERPDGGSEWLDVTLPESSPLIAVTNLITGELVISGTGTVEEYREAIASLTYKNSSYFCTPDSTGAYRRTISIKVFDGLSWSNEGVVSITMELTHLPTISVANAEIWEGDTGDVRTLVFEITLDAAARIDSIFTYRLIAGTAIAGKDYLDAPHEICIARGESSATLEVTVYGNYNENNPSLDFTLELILNPDSGLLPGTMQARGLLKDDDIPVALGVRSEYTEGTVHSFEEGERRYLYSFTPTEDGWVRWSGVGLGGMTFTVYEQTDENTAAHAGMPIAVSSWKNGLEMVEWYAKAGTVYVLKLTGSLAFCNLAMSLFPIQVDQSLLVDPLLDKDGNLNVRVENGRLVLGDGANAIHWNFDDWARWGALNLTTTKGANLLLTLMPGESIGFHAETGTLTVNSNELTFGGFSNYSFVGYDGRETLTLTGSSGDDSLEYADGAGFLRSDLGGTLRTIYFRNITNLVVEAGSGGNHVAVVSESAGGDTLRFAAGRVDYYGGGYHATLVAFNRVTCNSDRGGEGTLIVEKIGNADLIVQVGSVVMRGSGAGGEFQYVATRQQFITIDAEGGSGEVLMIASTPTVEYQATLGTLSAVETRTGATILVQYANRLVLVGLNEESSQIQIADTAGVSVEGERLGETGQVVYRGSNNQVLTIPGWVLTPWHTILGQGATLLSGEIFGESVDSQGGISADSSQNSDDSSERFDVVSPMTVNPSRLGPNHSDETSGGSFLEANRVRAAIFSESVAESLVTQRALSDELLAFLESLHGTSGRNRRKGFLLAFAADEW